MLISFPWLLALPPPPPLTTPGHMHSSFFFHSHPKDTLGSADFIIIVREKRPRTFLNVSWRMRTTRSGVPCRPLASFSGINQGLWSPLWLKSANTQSHFRGSSLSPHQQQQQQQQQQRHREVFMWLTLLASVRSSFLLAGVCANVSSEMAQEYFKRPGESCNGTLQFYF